MSINFNKPVANLTTQPNCFVHLPPKGLNGIQSARATSRDPIHPGDEIETVTVRVNGGNPREYLGLKLTLLVYMENQQAATYEHIFTSEEFSYLSVVEVDQVESGSPY